MRASPIRLPSRRPSRPSRRSDRLTILLILVVGLILGVVAATGAWAVEVLPLVPERVDPVDRREAMAELYTALTDAMPIEKVAPFEITIPSERLATLEQPTTGAGPLLVGVHADVDFTFDPTAKRQWTGSTVDTDERTIWSGVFRSSGASGLRLHLRDVDLPPGTELYVLDRHGQAFGPYTGLGPVATGAFWTHTVAGDELILQVHRPLVDLRQAKPVRHARRGLFTVTEVSHLGDRYGLGIRSPEKAFCSWNSSCVENSLCSVGAQPPEIFWTAPLATAFLLVSKNGQTYSCTGGLLNDKIESLTPYLLTANHCFSTPTAANSLEATFQWAVPCGQSCGTQSKPPGTFPRNLGSTLLATGSGNDFTLVQLYEPAPGGSVLLGWTTAPVSASAGTSLYRISHPAGSPQAYSSQTVDTTTSECSNAPRGDYIYSDPGFGGVEGGSSGSPVLNDAAQVVGQLHGLCHAPGSSSCESGAEVVDGAFSEFWPAVSVWLDPRGHRVPLRVMLAGTDPSLSPQVGQLAGTAWEASTGNDSPGFMIYGPYAPDFGVGKKAVIFRTLVDNVTAGGNVLNIDVYDSTAGQVLASRAVPRSEFQQPWVYQDVTLNFDLDGRAGHKIETRAYWHDISYVKIATVEVLDRPYTFRWYEAESSPVLYHHVGRAAGDGWAAVPALDNAGTLIFGPYADDLGTGDKRAIFRTMADHNVGSGAAATIDVWDATSQQTLAQATLSPSDFVAIDEYQSFALDFNLDGRGGHQIELRVAWHDLVGIKVDYLSVENR